MGFTGSIHSMAYIQYLYRSDKFHAFIFEILSPYIRFDLYNFTHRASKVTLPPLSWGRNNIQCSTLINTSTKTTRIHAPLFIPIHFLILQCHQLSSSVHLNATNAAAAPSSSKWVTGRRSQSGASELAATANGTQWLVLGPHWFPLREATSGVSATSSFKHSTKTQLELKRLDIQNKRLGRYRWFTFIH